VNKVVYNSTDRLHGVCMYVCTSSDELLRLSGLQQLSESREMSASRASLSILDDDNNDNDESQQQQQDGDDDDGPVKYKQRTTSNVCSLHTLIGPLYLVAYRGAGRWSGALRAETRRGWQIWSANDTNWGHSG